MNIKKNESYLILSHPMTWIQYDPVSSYFMFIWRVIIKTEVDHSFIFQLTKTKEYIKVRKTHCSHFTTMLLDCEVYIPELVQII